MKQRRYPPDGGLKEQVRAFEDTFDFYRMIRHQFVVASKNNQTPIKT